MLRNVVLVSGVIVTLAAYPLLFGPVKVSEPVESRPPQPAAEPTKQLARVETKPLGNAVRLKRDPSGHFFGEFKLNGRRVDAMIDTGATVIAVNASTARQAGIRLKPGDFTAQVGTANGTVAAAPVKLDTVELGRIRVRDVDAVVLDDKALPSTLVGMSFLKRLKRFEVQGEMLVLAQ